MAYPLKDLTGQPFGRLTVSHRLPKQGSKDRAVVWQCECECGSSLPVISYNLRSGNTQSCGCHKKQVSAELARAMTPPKLGQGATT